MSQELSRIVRDALAARGSALLRNRTPRQPRGADGIIDFSSNDYLGLSRHPKVVEAMRQGAKEWGAGSAASPLITGYTEAHRSAEEAIARWKGTSSAVLLPSGYQANHAAIGALVGAAQTCGRSIRFFFDKLVHASLIDAIVGSGKPFRSFAHNDLGKLERLLEGANDVEMRIVVTESIFSMDGDAAELRGIVALKKKWGFVPVVDEAHGSGVYGPGGSGYASEAGVSSDVDVFIVTLSKAVGCAGGAVCGSREIQEAVVNFGRAYIYSTALAPALAVACEAAIGVMGEEPERQARVGELARRVRAGLAKAGWEIPSGDSPIVPVIVGDANRALELAEGLRKSGLLVMPVRPPTVAKGSSRLRITLSAEQTDEQVEYLLARLADARNGGGAQ